jgi:RimJ/RimL family protein N-acetyltransferase
MKIIFDLLILSGLGLLSACQSLSPIDKSPDINKEYKTDSFILAPLRPEHTDLDYKAVMGNKAFLRIVLGWGGWPSDSMTIDEDRSALENHFTEFKEKQAYAYAVFSADRKKIIGCIYVNPFDKISTSANMQYWLTKDQLAKNIDKLVLKKLLELLPKWGYTTVFHSVGKNYNRGNVLAKEFGMTAYTSQNSELQNVYQWKR